MNRRRMDPQRRRIMEVTIYIRIHRVHHAVKRRPEKERKVTAENLMSWREQCWQSYRQLVDTGVRDLPGSPWAWFSIRPGVKIIG